LYFILRERHRFRVKDRVQKRIFGPRRDEVTAEWRKFHNGELHNFTQPKCHYADQMKEN
jgi:hypothetical protein